MGWRRSAIALPLAAAAACSPIDGPPGHWGEGAVLACGDHTVRIHQGHGFQAGGIRLADHEVQWHDDGLQTAAWRQWTAGFTDGKHGYKLTDTRYWMALGENGPRLTVIAEVRPATPREAQWLTDYDYERANEGGAPAGHPPVRWHEGSHFQVETFACRPEDIQAARGKLGDLTWADLIIYMVLDALGSI